MVKQQIALSNLVALVGGTVNVLLTAFKFYAGIIAGSSAMISDAAHSASDIVATLTVFLGIRLANRPADLNHHYGHGRLESVAAKLVSLLLMATGGLLGWEAIHLLLQGGDTTPGAIALWAAAGSILIKEALFRYVNGIGRQLRSPAIQAEALHHRSDAFSSIAALLGIAGARLGYPILDPLASLLVAGFIVRLGFGIYWRSVGELVDTAPDQRVLANIREAARLTPGVQQVNAVRARLHGAAILVDLKISVDPQVTVQEGHRIGQAAKRQVQQAEAEVADVLVHVNPGERSQP